MRRPTVRCKASGCARWNATAGHFANGLRPGDIITSVNQRAVSELKDFYEIVNREESALLLHVLRGGVWVYMVAK
jgi:PDZ domain-containing secreted protein